MKERFPIEGILSLLEKEKDFVFLETAKPDTENFLSYVFLRPKKIISTSKIDQIEACFAELDQALKKGYYVAGFLSYEAGEAFEERLKRRQAFNFPLLWFGAYKEPLIYNHREGKFNQKVVLPKKHKQESYIIKNIRPNISQGSYKRAISKIKHLIAKGFTYQVNYTFKLKFSFSGSAAALYLNLRNNQSVAYSALIKTGERFILSFSPEMFFSKKGNKICTRPMKGTAGRGKNLQEDSENIKQLESSLKNRSENVMIVDLLRSDLGRISATGSVRVPRLFNVEKYETLLQMTSDIKSRVSPGHSAFDIFNYIFPSGSVTGAPKIKTMEIIRELEKEHRRVYTGSIGFFSPKTLGIFNVAIRTLLIDSRKGSGEMGVGSGIVYDSNACAEYDECCLKANFLTRKPQKFKLIETMLWQPVKGYLFLKLHLKRLENSARYFNFLYRREDILRQLMKLRRRFKQDTYRVRLNLDKAGKVEVEPSLLEAAAPREPKVFLAAKKTYSQDLFLYHKTTFRRLYDRQYKRAKLLGFYDLIFANEKGEITEGAISNVFVRKNGRFYTPPITCGLLDGVYRRYLLASAKFPIKEKVLFKEDLFEAEEIYLSNSVRGLVKVRLEDKNH